MQEPSNTRLKFCKHCGEPIDSDSTYCAFCGGSVVNNRPCVETAQETQLDGLGVVTPPSSTPEQVSDTHVHGTPLDIPQLGRAWPRYWARSLDLLLEMTLLVALIGATIPNSFQAGGVFGDSKDDQALIILLVPAALFLDAIVMAICGQTAGKWLAGLKLRDLRGERLTLGELLRRNWKLYFRGLGCGLWIVSLFTLARNHSKVREHQLTSWDQEIQSRVFQKSPGGWRTHLAASVCIVLLIVCMSLPIALRATPETQLARAAREVNTRTPQSVDAETRLDGAETLPGLIFQYNYTLVNVEAIALDIQTFKAGIKERLQQNQSAVCNQPAFKAMWKMGATVRFKYADKNGLYLGVIDVPHSDCEKHGAV